MNSPVSEYGAAKEFRSVEEASSAALQWFSSAPEWVTAVYVTIRTRGGQALAVSVDREGVVRTA